MGRQPCCDKVGLKKGPWTAEEDKKLINFILNNGQCCWRAVPKLAGLLRCGKSCRLRWTNYLRPDLKRGFLSEHEEKMVIDLHAQLGNRWSKIASHLPGRTDNEIKNNWNTHIKKKLRKMGIDPLTHKPFPTSEPPPPPPPQEQQEVQEQQQAQSYSTNAMAELEQNKETETSVQSSTTEETKVEEEKRMTSTFETMEPMNYGFCIDDVPLIEPHEMLVPCTAAPSSSSSTITTTSSSSSSSHGPYNNLFLEGFQFADFEWPDNDIDWWVDDLSSCWDLLINDVDSDRKQVDALDDHYPHAPINQYPEMVLDKDSSTYGIL
ncbi:hypothetical protein P3X46_016152 [Hevea brasiliensis]|uniref:Uncharacterized protein n=1 Tax=Hevea brasiliensis TaxID=3981 RepID=A0ABQ9LZJ8_HEVBR|nr:transcription factor MYB20 [Hevea brasiliensis]KAJ9172968.1 hypothetical protein P3X46_016152 [Hevea brasiliensis]